MSLKLGDVVVLPEGLLVGMGKLRRDVVGVVDRVEKDDAGNAFYGVSYRNSKSKVRHTYVRAGDVRKTWARQQ